MLETKRSFVGAAGHSCKEGSRKGGRVTKNPTRKHPFRDQSRATKPTSASQREYSFVYRHLRYVRSGLLRTSRFSLSRGPVVVSKMTAHVGHGTGRMEGEIGI